MRYPRKHAAVYIYTVSISKRHLACKSHCTVSRFADYGILFLPYSCFCLVDRSTESVPMEKGERSIVPMNTGTFPTEFFALSTHETSSAVFSGTPCREIAYFVSHNGYYLYYPQFRSLSIWIFSNLKHGRL